MGRPDKGNPFLFTASGKLRIFGQETIAGMDGVHFLFLGQGDNLVHIQVGFDRTGSTGNQVSLIRLGTEQRHLVLRGIDGNCLNTKLLAGTNNTNGDFAAVSNQYLVKFFHLQLSLHYKITACRAWLSVTDQCINIYCYSIIYKPSANEKKNFCYLR